MIICITKNLLLKLKILIYNGLLQQFTSHYFSTMHLNTFILITYHLLSYFS